MPQRLHEPIDPCFFENRMLFLGMQEEELHLLAALAEAHRYGPGEVIFHEGDAGRCLYLIAEGEVEILQAGPDGASATTTVLRAWDSESPLLSQYEGDFFGEMSVVDSEPRSATARALSPLVVYTLDADDLRCLAIEHPTTFLVLIMNIARILSRRLRQYARRPAAAGHGQGQDGSGGNGGGGV